MIIITTTIINKTNILDSYSIFFPPSPRSLFFYLALFSPPRPFYLALILFSPQAPSHND